MKSEANKAFVGAILFTLFPVHIGDGFWRDCKIGHREVGKERLIPFDCIQVVDGHDHYNLQAIGAVGRATTESE